MIVCDRVGLCVIVNVNVGLSELGLEGEAILVERRDPLLGTSILSCVELSMEQVMEALLFLLSEQVGFDRVMVGGISTRIYDPEAQGLLC